MTTSIEHKRGDSFDYNVVVTDSGGSTIDLTNWTIKCQLRTSRDQLIETLTIEEDDYSEGSYNLVCDDTTDWPVGNLYADIEYTDTASKIQSTETFIVQVVKDYTYD